MGITVVFVVLLTIAVVNSDEVDQKRLLLNDPDVASQIASMARDIQLLKQQNVQLTNRLTTTESNFQQKLQAAGSGSVYIRWGKQACIGGKTQTVYSGFAAGQRYAPEGSLSSQRGGAANMLCLPNDPELSNLTTARDSFIYGTEFEENVLRAGSANEDVPCALCKNTKTHTSVMIPGRKSCYSGWVHEYHGILASGSYGHSASSYICVDIAPDFVQGGQKNDNGRLLYFTTTKCGSLACPPYKDNVAVNCVVCSQ